MPKKEIYNKLDVVSPNGFSLPIAVLAGFLLLLGSLALASRSSLGLFGSAFQNKNWAARSAAETGMNVIVNELNRPRNRWLNVVRPGGTNGLWNTSGAAPQQNPCTATQSPPIPPDYSRINPQGASGPPYGKWYLSESGVISSSQGSDKRSFELIEIKRQNLTKTNGLSSELSVWRDRADTPSGVGSVTILVKGQAYQSGKVIASVVLERTYELTPKCCGIPFGGKHGNIDYSISNSGTTECIPDNQLGLGLLAGAAGTNSGSITVKGGATSVISATSVPVDPIYCIASTTAGCAINTTSSTVGISVIDIDLPKAYDFCNPPGGSKIYSGSICSSGPLPPGSLASIPAVSACDPAAIGAFKKGYPCKGGFKKIVYDFSSSSLPAFCAISTSNEAHCNIQGPLSPDPSTTSLTEVNFVTGARKARLYFPGENCSTSQTGSACEEFDNSGKGNLSISNCSDSDPTTGECTASKNITDLSIFGTNQSLDPPQTITLGGTQNSESLFIYFPTAKVTLSGTSQFSGVLWTNDLGSTGTPTWTIPRTGLTEVLALMGLTGSVTGKPEPLFFDFVLRGVNRQRWLSG